MTIDPSAMSRVARVQLVDYRAGNLFSIRRALEVVGAEVSIVRTRSDWDDSATHVVLPGVGAYATGMTALRDAGLDVGLRERARKGLPLLGICLGAQLLFERSDEFGRHEGLGLLAGEVALLPADSGRVPHIGWAPCAGQEGLLHPVLQGIAAPWFYFVHSYYFAPQSPTRRLLSATVGRVEFTAAAGYESVLGVQFHPERSGEAGLDLLRNFCAWEGDDA